MPFKVGNRVYDTIFEACVLSQHAEADDAIQASSMTPHTQKHTCAHRLNYTQAQTQNCAAPKTRKQGEAGTSTRRSSHSLPQQGLLLSGRAHCFGSALV
jgi:hypothetical protein